MKRITMFAFVAVAMMLSAVQARPLSETKWLLEGRRYAGEWEERVDGETLKLSFLPDGHGVFSYRGSMQPFSWTADGKGKIKGFDKPKGGRQVLDITYIPEEDVMDCGFGTNKTSLGFTGRCAFKSETLSDEVVKFRTQLAEDMPKTLEEQFERLKKSGDTRLKHVTNLGSKCDSAETMIRRIRRKSNDLQRERDAGNPIADVSNLKNWKLEFPRECDFSEGSEPWDNYTDNMKTLFRILHNRDVKLVRDDLKSLLNRYDYRRAKYLTVSILARPELTNDDYAEAVKKVTDWEGDKDECFLIGIITDSRTPTAVLKMIKRERIRTDWLREELENVILDRAGKQTGLKD